MSVLRLQTVPSRISRMTATFPLAAITSSVASFPQSRLSLSFGKSATPRVSSHGVFLGFSVKYPSFTRNPHAVSRKSGSRTYSVSTIYASIAVGDKLPESELSYLDSDNNVVVLKVSELTAGKKAVIFAVPGAFTPTCSNKHVPAFVSKADELRSKGVEIIACVSVNDVFVLKAWGETLAVKDKVQLLADINGAFTKALGLEYDLTDKPVALGVRSRRYALLAEDGVVKVLNAEEGGAFTASGPDEILSAL